MSNVIVIAGMHRSGTSMVSRLLNLCGVHLGGAEDMHPAAVDNPAGYWEHAGFVELNERILELSGTGWGLHLPLGNDWLDNSELAELEPKARELLADLRDHASGGAWGWKDPRNSLTLPFWLRLVEEPVRVVQCLRHPADVRASLAARDQQLGDDVWFKYNEAVAHAVPDDHRIVTHYDAYFVDPEGELRRLLEFLDVTVDDEQIAQACTSIQTNLRHNESVDLRSTAPAAGGLYLDLCADAGEIFERACGPAIEAAAGELVRIDTVLQEAQEQWSRLFANERQNQGVSMAEHRRLLADATRTHEDLNRHIAMVEELRAEVLRLGHENGVLQHELDKARAGIVGRIGAKLGRTGTRS